MLLFLVYWLGYTVVMGDTTSSFQKMTSSCTAKGNKYYRYSTHHQQVRQDLEGPQAYNIQALRSHMGFKQVGQCLWFPSWLSSLSAGKSLEFVYIHSADYTAYKGGN
ncbi:hypothetical protein Dsin_007891 [Dipteronia sinensis]|uniref:Carbohydrate binding domain-containing protein n=1 Tax=Dipteronia sinensis TaxID=43782 RepID=A0AAE0B2D0_9ROSI|nr:hypothetical protein Dsin_007891 [Dipteronia sinensis]